MKKLFRLLIVFMTVMFLGLSMAKANEVCKDGETETLLEGKVRCLYVANPASVACSVGEYNPTTEKCEYNADVTEYGCTTEPTEETQSFSGNIPSNCIGVNCTDADNDGVEESCESIKCYSCPGYGELNSAKTKCYDYVRTSNCATGYNNPFPHKWACKDEGHAMSDDHVCSYTGTTTEASCNDTTHIIEGENCVYEVVINEPCNNCSVPNTPTVVFERERYTCDVNEVIQTYVVAPAAINSIASDYTEVAFAEEATNGKCPASETNCKEINITCASVGSANITVGVTDANGVVEVVVADPNAETIEITYDVNGGTACDSTSFTVRAGEKLGNLCTPTRKGYKFNGWHTLKSSDGAKVTSDTVATTDMVIYAHWKKTTIDTNANTGIGGYAFMLVTLIAISGYVYIVVSRRNKALN